MKNLQKGRSMIEMLGVLAIVGVLSIGGLAGYQMAMNRYRASALSDYASRCVVVAQTRYMSGRIGSTQQDCSSILGSEQIPSFLSSTTTGTGENATTTSAYVKVSDDENGVATVIAGSVPSAVQSVLQDRFNGQSIGGVTYSGTGGGESTFTFGQTPTTTP